MNVTSDTFESEVLNSELPVLVDFWAPWCGPCKAIAPEFEKLVSEYAGKVKICKVDCEEAGDLVNAYSICSIPTFLVFEKGKVTRTQNGGTISKVKELISNFA